MADEKRHSFTVEEAKAKLAEIARDGEGNSQFRALMAVISQETGTLALPEPLSDIEIVERLARMIKAAGPTASQLAYRKAFPQAQRPIHFAAPKITEADVPPIDPKTLPINLRSLYRMFPEIKKPGVPKGFPIHQGLAVQKEWCQREAKKMLMDREQKKFDQIAVEARPEPANAEQP